MEHLDDPFVGSPQDEEIDVLAQKEKFRELEREDVPTNPFDNDEALANIIADIEVAKINQRADVLKSVLSQAKTLKLDTPDKVLESAERFLAWLRPDQAEAGETGAGTVSGVVTDVPPYLRD